eukprot:Gb_39341 [translate_table: standard]
MPPNEVEDPTSTSFKVSVITYNVSSSSICGAMVPVTSDGISVPGAPIRSSMYSLLWCVPSLHPITLVVWCNSHEQCFHLQGSFFLADVTVCPLLCIAQAPTRLRKN